MTMVIGDRLAFGGMCAVPVYLFYIFEKDGHVTGPPTIYELPNDATALKEAKKILNDRGIEIWRAAKITLVKSRRSLSRGLSGRPSRSCNKWLPPSSRVPSLNDSFAV